jgi:hypothetical protein
MLIGLGVFFAGYASTYYGITQLRGMNYGFLDLVLPGRWVKAAQTPTQMDGNNPAAVSPNAGSGVNQNATEGSQGVYIPGAPPGSFSTQGQGLLG